MSFDMLTLIVIFVCGGLAVCCAQLAWKLPSIQRPGLLYFAVDLIYIFVDYYLYYLAGLVTALFYIGTFLLCAPKKLQTNQNQSIVLFIAVVLGIASYASITSWAANFILYYVPNIALYVTALPTPALKACGFALVVVNLISPYVLLNISVYAYIYFSSLCHIFVYVLIYLSMLHNDKCDNAVPSLSSSGIDQAPLMTQTASDSSSPSVVSMPSLAGAQVVSPSSGVASEANSSQTDVVPPGVPGHSPQTMYPAAPMVVPSYPSNQTPSSGGPVYIPPQF